MIDDGDKLKEKRQKGGNENTEPRLLVCNIFFIFIFTLLSPFYSYLSSIHGCSVMGAHFLSFLFFIES